MSDMCNYEPVRNLLVPTDWEIRARDAEAALQKAAQRVVDLERDLESERRCTSRLQDLYDGAKNSRDETELHAVRQSQELDELRAQAISQTRALSLHRTKIQERDDKFTAIANIVSDVIFEKTVRPRKALKKIWETI